MFDAGDDRISAFYAVCRDDHRHISHGAHDRNILRALVCCTSLPKGDAPMRGDDFHVKVLIAYVGSDLLGSTHGRKYSHG